jgi:F-type H+-transporting ATPase subunit d
VHRKCEPEIIQDFTRIYASLGLGKGMGKLVALLPLQPCLKCSCCEIETISALQAFRKRNLDAQRIHSQLSAQPTTVDFAHYRSVLKNQAVIDEAEKVLKDFKPVTYDAKKHIGAIEEFEAKAVCGFGISCIVTKLNQTATMIFPSR